MQKTTHVHDAFRKAYSSVDSEIRAKNETSGSTAVTAVIANKNGKRMLYTANVGDARIVLR
jgi:serine/threonine protein phosphatase PrpC